ncbi:homocysteine S-methyltransferase [Mycobacterium sp. 1274756.6]|uniref:homocysteine S-methyltransferase n=1 Tax=Mycobacterium sp. 1274756.6 TaxID=1834076 RepID=UPI0007FE4BB1|nr:homocysteine S-methyltransferase [Mycobacterium sp. 1274756.6]OBJ72340.1 homocysteine S-methyltransferase [Mycobacterium sp. 1274756.6]
MRFAVPNDTVLISDGGLATELEAAGFDLTDPLWSARLLLDAPQSITAVHEAFFRSGAQIATTASYQASFPGFAARGLDEHRTAELLGRSVALARAAATAVGGHRWVAASIGPYGAALADGSEYRGRYGLSVSELTAWHRRRFEVLSAAGPDVLACETVPDVVEAEALAALVAEGDLPAWLSYTVDGPRTRAGQPLAEAFAVAAEVDRIVAVGVNCCAPDDVLPAIAIARAVTDKPVIVYPNSGERWARRWVGPRRFRAGEANAWVAAGARIVGGCCRVRPADIAALARRLAAPAARPNPTPNG